MINQLTDTDNNSLTTLETIEENNQLQDTDQLQDTENQTFDQSSIFASVQSELDNLSDIIESEEIPLIKPKSVTFLDDQAQKIKSKEVKARVEKVKVEKIKTERTEPSIKTVVNPVDLGNIPMESKLLVYYNSNNHCFSIQNKSLGGRVIGHLQNNQAIILHMCKITQHKKSTKKETLKRFHVNFEGLLTALPFPENQASYYDAYGRNNPDREQLKEAVLIRLSIQNNIPIVEIANKI